MRITWIWIISIALIWPVALRAATVGDKPVDLVLSDGVFLLFPLAYWFLVSKKPPSLPAGVSQPRTYLMMIWLSVTFIIYCMSLSGVGVGISGEWTRVISAFKLSKSIGFVILGIILGTWTDPFELIDITSRAYGLLVGLTMLFTIADPNFPLGDWGKYIGEFELAGYPNSPMTFYAALVPLLLASVESTKILFVRVGGWVLSGCSALIIVGSMSRSSTLVLIIGVGIYLISTGRLMFLVSCSMVMFVVSVVGFGLFSAVKDTQVVRELTYRISVRMDRTTEDEDPSSGRFDIWALAIELWVEKPVFGYMFESFSRYSEFDTPHQQYLEVLHKCGGLGLFLYMWLLLCCFRSITRLLPLAIRGSPISYQLHAVRAMMVGVMVGNLTQPNLSYSVTGNVFFLVFGLLGSSRAMLSVKQPMQVQRAVTKVSMPQLVKLRHA